MSSLIYGDANFVDRIVILPSVQCSQLKLFEGFQLFSKYKCENHKHNEEGLSWNFLPKNPLFVADPLFWKKWITKLKQVTLGPHSF